MKQVHVIRRFRYLPESHQGLDQEMLWLDVTVAQTPADCLAWRLEITELGYSEGRILKSS